MLTLRVKVRAGQIPSEQAEYLVSGKRMPQPPPMTARVAEYLTDLQWAAACALREIDPFRTLLEDLDLNMEGWREWNDGPKPEMEDLPGEWAAKCTPFAKLLVLRALRTDRVTSAITTYIVEQLGERYMSQPPFDMADTFADSSYKSPLFFTLFPGVDPGADIEKLGFELGFTEEAGTYVPIAMGQGQEKNAENTLDRFTKEGGWLFLQNVSLMQAWLPILERKLEIAAEEGHEDFRCFLSSEPPASADQQIVSEGIMQNAIKVA
jgi:dynein heavy chain